MSCHGSLRAVCIATSMAMLVSHRHWDCLREDEDVLQEDLDWSCSRPCSRANGQQLSVDNPGAFIESFTANEYEFYLAYRASAPKGLFSLNQNPKHKGMKAQPNQDMVCATMIVCLLLQGDRCSLFL